MYLCLHRIIIPTVSYTDWLNFILKTLIKFIKHANANNNNFTHMLLYMYLNFMITQKIIFLLSYKNL